MWDNTEPDDRDRSGLLDFATALAVGVALGAIGFMLALAAGVRVPSLWG